MLVKLKVTRVKCQTNNMSHLQEAGSAELGWAFWTKVVVVIIGFIGGLSFVFAQVNSHVHYSPIKEPTKPTNSGGH